MGLTEELRRLNTQEVGTRFIYEDGRPFAEFPIKKGYEVSPTSEFEILRGDLALVLYEATKDHPDIEYVFGTTVTKVVSNDDEAVTVELSNGQTKRYHLLVAAEGQWSRVRKQCFPSEEITVVPKHLYVAYWTKSRLPEDDDWWNIYHGVNSRVVFTRPDPHGTIRASLMTMPLNDSQGKECREASRGDRQSQEDLMKKRFADVDWRTQELLETMKDSDDFYFQSVDQIRMKRWSIGRVVCLGDSAHAPTPLTGMGTSLAIIGGHILAGELSKLPKDQHPSKALEAYDATFRPFVESIQDIPSFVPGVMHPATAFKRSLVRTFLRVASMGMKVFLSLPYLPDRYLMANDAEDFKAPSYPAFQSFIVDSKANGTAEAKS